MYAFSQSLSLSELPRGAGRPQSEQLREPLDSLGEVAYVHKGRGNIFPAQRADGEKNQELWNEKWCNELRNWTVKWGKRRRALLDPTKEWPPRPASCVTQWQSTNWFFICVFFMGSPAVWCTLSGGVIQTAQVPAHGVLPQEVQAHSGPLQGDQALVCGASLPRGLEGGCSR